MDQDHVCLYCGIVKETNMDEITRAEHEEFKKRIEDEEKRQNRRLDTMEGRVDKLIDMQVSMAQLQVGITNISEELKKLATEVEAIKREPADKWNKAVWIVVSIVITAVVTYAISALK